VRAVLALLVAAAASSVLGPVAIAPSPLSARPPRPAEFTFTAVRPAEVIASITANCHQCAWHTEGREAAVLRLTLDDNYSQHLPLVSGSHAEYRVFLGPVPAGRHRLQIEQDSEQSARGLPPGAAYVEAVQFEQVAATRPDHDALSLAPFIYARANTIGRFTDVPVFMWYETEPAAAGMRYRYSVIFTNEDGGTPADRLMATWGRTTDIEYIYSVVVERSGRIVSDDYQGPEHDILRFRGAREGRHPLLRVVTDNNMVSDAGVGPVRYAPAPIYFPLEERSRESVMDAYPWLYSVMTLELVREGKIAEDAPPGKGLIPDPRRYVYVEACGEAGIAALAFAVQVGDTWHASDRGVPEYRFVRAGCFRGAVPLPAGIDLSSVRALRFQAFERPNPPGAGQPTTERPTARLTHINKVFMLDASYRPGASRFRWRGDQTLVPGGPPVEFALP
jgi:hypothetical protein